MTFKEQEQITKKNSVELLSELINFDGENIMAEILRLGVQNLMELERDDHIGVGSYVRGEERRSQRNGFKSSTLYTRVGPLVLQVPQTRDGRFYPSILERVNQELNRRSRVVRIFPNPKSCLRLFTALLKEWQED